MRKSLSHKEILILKLNNLLATSESLEDKLVTENNQWQCRATVLRSDIQNLIDYVEWSVEENDHYELEIAPKAAEKSCGWDTARTYCLFLNFDGKTDWRLPTKEELNEIYESDNDFGSGRYWASNEQSVDNAWSQSFENGSRYDQYKCHGGLYVRPVRDIK
jgi:hypothetical protein